jgi:ankyrin repeat protein
VLLLLSYFSPQSGNTALHLASSNGLPEVVRILVQSHADVDVKNGVSSYILNHLTSSTNYMYTVNLEFFCYWNIFIGTRDNNQIKIAK